MTPCVSGYKHRQKWVWFESAPGEVLCVLWSPKMTTGSASRDVVSWTEACSHVRDSNTTTKQAMADKTQLLLQQCNEVAQSSPRSCQEHRAYFLWCWFHLKKNNEKKLTNCATSHLLQPWRQLFATHAPCKVCNSELWKYVFSSSDHNSKVCSRTVQYGQKGNTVPYQNYITPQK